MFIIRIVVEAIFDFLFSSLLNKKNKKHEENIDIYNFEVRQSAGTLLIGIICAIFFSFLIALAKFTNNETATIWVYLIFSFFTFMGILLMIYYKMWKLKVENNQISYFPFFGRNKFFTVDSITKVRKKEEKIIVFSGDKELFSVESSCRGFDALIARLKKERINVKKF